MRRSVLALVVTAVSLSGCYVRAYEYREHEYLGSDHRPYRHERWHGEDVYRREDGRWYVRRNNEWVVRTEIVIQ